MRAEIDPQFFVLRTIAAGATLLDSEPARGHVDLEQAQFRQRKRAGIQRSHASGSVHQHISSTCTREDNRFGGIYSANFDIFNSRILQQRLTGFYNAQCCGVAFEYQTYNLSFTRSGVSKDRRFFMSFTLAGLGNFSPFSGAMGGVPR